jgi:hypothetical protein
LNLSEELFFDIELSENGNYTKRFGSEIKTFTENGTWSISKDGKYIIFNNKSDKKIKQPAPGGFGNTQIKW